MVKKKNSPEQLFKDMYKCLNLFINQEAKLWGAQLVTLKNTQEDVLEEANHIIYKFQHTNEEEFKEYLKSKEVEEFIQEVLHIHEEFKELKKQINRQEVFKNTITSLTLLLMNEEIYSYFEDIFLLEKQLQEVLLWQENEFKELFKTSNELKHFDDKQLKAETIYGKLTHLRTILAGNLDHHELWEDEMQGFSNCSNILHALKAKVIQLEKYYYLNSK
ncbi:MAG: hypothetical protein ACLFPL_02345 [Candidatus Nanoarchaeia archaeon]